MKTPRIFSQIAIFLAAALSCGTMNAAINIYITPDGTSSDIQISGTFDHPVAANVGNVVGIGFAPTNAWHGDPLAFVSVFNSSAATMVNTTTGGSAEITRTTYEPILELEFYAPPPIYMVPLPIFAGDVLALTSHGPVNTGLPFADFTPGSYVFINSDLGSTTFNTFILVPEPSPFALAGVGSVLLLLHRRSRGPLIQRLKAEG